MTIELLVGFVIMGLIGAAIGNSRDRTNAGFWWGFFLGPLGWLVLLVGPNPRREKEEREKRAQGAKMQKMQEAHLAELRELRDSFANGRRSAPVEEDKYWVKMKGRELGPVDKMELLQMYSSGSITLDTEVALDAESGERTFRALSDEIPVGITLEL